MRRSVVVVKHLHFKVESFIGISSLVGCAGGDVEMQKSPAVCNLLAMVIWMLLLRWRAVWWRNYIISRSRL